MISFDVLCKILGEKTHQADLSQGQTCLFNGGIDMEEFPDNDHELLLKGERNDDKA
jgi:hypothetical protein